MKKNMKVFVLMPFGSDKEYEGGNDESNYVYDEIICPGVKLALGEDVIIEREVDKNRAGSITKAIVSSIVTADVVIVDITGWNPNVFFELGMRYALRNSVTILLAQTNTRIPFDIRAYRLIYYSRFKPSDARTKISSFVEEGISDNAGSDSIVFDTFRNLSVSIPGILDSQRTDQGRQPIIMRWEDFMARIEWVVGWLSPEVNEGHFVPDAVLGISNGGLIVADLIGKAVFSGKNTPILGLWAKRYTKPRSYFENSYNDAALECIKRDIPEGQSATILLVDDHFGTGNTAKQAIDYVQARLGNTTEVIFLPLVSRRTEYIQTVEEYFPYSARHEGAQLFRLTKDEFIKRINTSANYFPYLMKQLNEGLEHIGSE
ncbi:MAG: phosphoribosyltransferase [candidate division Zixibacteria bacterium]|nr:phosphoribosyltransferase [candidate division Zixibacteria bacterium]